MRIGCAECHQGPLPGGGSLKTIGGEKSYWIAIGSDRRDAGVFDSTMLDADRYRFRVSMLRNIADTGPYFHDGSVPDLGKAVRIMADVQVGVVLDDGDVTVLIAFLESLTGDVPINHGLH